MNIPGFFAEASLYETKEVYRGNPSGAETEGAVRPTASIKPQLQRCYSYCRPCINGVQNCTYACFPGVCHDVPSTELGHFGKIVCDPVYSHYSKACWHSVIAR